VPLDTKEPSHDEPHQDPSPIYQVIRDNKGYLLVYCYPPGLMQHISQKKAFKFVFNYLSSIYERIPKMLGKFRLRIFLYICNNFNFIYRTLDLLLIDQSLIRTITTLCLRKRKKRKLTSQ